MVNEDKPNLQTRLNIPGLHFFPRLTPESKAQSARLKNENAGNDFYWNSEDSDTTIYTELIAAQKATYPALENSDTESEL